MSAADTDMSTEREEQLIGEILRDHGGIDPGKIGRSSIWSRWDW
jgi:hypothetical protein